jgi:O-antigen ligase
MLIIYLFKNKTKALEIVRIKYFKLYVLLLGYMVIHVFIAVNNYWAYMQFQTLVSYLIVGISFCFFIDSPLKLYKIASFYVLIIAICAADRISGLRLFGGSGPMGDENDFALAMNVAFPIAFFLGKAEKSSKKWLFWTACGLMTLGNMASASRGGFLSLAVAGTACFLYSKNKIKTSMLILLLGIIAWSFATPEFRNEILDIGYTSAEQDTGKDRIELWKVAWRAFMDNPIFGVGQGNMPIVMENYQYDQSGNSFWKRGLWGRAIHSIYFTALPELGLTGFIILFLMVKEVFGRFRKTRLLCNSYPNNDEFQKIANLNIALIISVFSYLVGGIFLSALYYPQFWNMTALIVTNNLIAQRLVLRNESEL